MVKSLPALALLLLAAFQAAADEPFEKIAIPQLAGHPVASDPAVTGYLFKPAGDGPFAAIVLMHGCDGLGWATRERTSWKLQRSYAERYAAHGYAALVLHSFAPRHVANVCGDGLRVAPRQRAWDAFAAASLLVARGTADPSRLVLQGDSHGGVTTLLALERGRWPAPPPFAAGIAFYPGCDSPTHFARGFTAPLIILIGEADDWTPAAQCQALAQRLAGAAPPVELHSFPGATHAFDFPLGPRVNRLGHHMQYDAAATEASWQSIDAFLARTVK